MNATIKRICGKGAESLKFLLALTSTLVLAAPSALAAIYWTGANSAAWNDTKNWTGSSGYLYFNNSNSRSKSMEWSENLTKFTYIASNYKSLYFSGGTAADPFVMNGKGFTYNNTSGTAAQSYFYMNGSTAALWFYNGTLKVKSFSVESTSSAWLKVGNGSDATTIQNTSGEMKFMDGTYIADKATVTSAGNLNLRNNVNLEFKNATTTAKCVNMAVNDGKAAKAVFNGGSLTVKDDNTIVGYGSNTYGELYATNLTLNATGRTLKIGGYSASQSGSTGIVEKVGGDWTVGSIQMGVATDAYSRFYHRGGTTTADAITLDGDALMVFDGGTLKAGAAGTLISTSSGGVVELGANGGAIDTAGYAITVAANIGGAGASDGGLKVKGGGVVTLSGSVNYTGVTDIEVGTTLSATTTAAKDALVANGVIVTIPAGDVADSAVVFSLTSGDTLSPADLDAFRISGTNPGGRFELALSEDEKSIMFSDVAAGNYKWLGGSVGNNWHSANWSKDNAPAVNWFDNTGAIFDTDGDSAIVDSDVSATSITFKENATVEGSATLTAPQVTVLDGKAATISAPTAGALTKGGSGRLTLTQTREDQTTVAKGTLAMAPGATVDPANLKLGVNATKPVTFDYGGQTLNSNPTAYLGVGMDVTLTNGVFAGPSASAVALTDSNLPAVLTVGKDATVSGYRYSFNTETGKTINVKGGAWRHIATGDHTWIMQNSIDGKFFFNVTDGGEVSFQGNVYALTCRDGKAYNAPELHFAFDHSRLSIADDKYFYCGYDSGNDNAVAPVFTLAMTNSVLAAGTGGIYIGWDIGSETKANNGGSYTADFESCVITAKEFKVFHDRPLNAARFNDTRIVLSADSTRWIHTASEFEDVLPGEGELPIKPVTIGPDGLIVDTNGFNGQLRADPQGGPITKVGEGTMTVSRSLTAATALVVSNGAVAVNADLSFARPTSVAPGATLAVGGGNEFTGGLAFEAGAILSVTAANATLPDVAASTVSFAAGTKIKVPTALSQLRTPLVQQTTGAFAANVVDDLVLEGAPGARLEVGGDTIYLVADTITVGNKGLTSLVVSGVTPLTGVGGVNLKSLEVPAGAKLVYDPIKTPIKVNSEPEFGEADGGLPAGKLSLSANYAQMACGEIVLLTFTGSDFDPTTVFDEDSVAGDVDLDFRDAPNGTDRQLVLKVGGYPDTAPEVRILPIGDSITQGVTKDVQGDYPQYRTMIAARLAANGLKPVMKGVWHYAQNDAAGVQQPDDWRWHCGISGDSIVTRPGSGGVRDNLHLYLDVAGKVDVITLLIGTNDLGGEDSADEVYDNFQALVEAIHEQRPDALIVGATLLDRGGSENHDKVVAFNERLSDEYSGGSFPEGFVLLDLYDAVPLTTGATGNFFSDNLHLNWAGCALAADAFAGKIVESLPPDFAGTVDMSVTDEVQVALGAANVAELDDYRSGMMHVFTIDAPNAANNFAAASPYTSEKVANALGKPVAKVGYYLELVRAGTSRRRYVWVDLDAAGKTLDDIDFPWDVDKVQYIAQKLHVYSNDPSIHNIAPNDDTFRGIVEGTRFNYDKTDSLAGAPADILGDCGWNDNLATTSGTGYGCFQVHRIFSQGVDDEHWNDAEVLFAWNKWGAKQAANMDEIGIGTYACHASGKDTMDYTFTSVVGDGHADTVAAGAYQVRHLEIWVKFDGAAPVAQIGETKYFSIADALGSGTATAERPVTLLGDSSEHVLLSSDKTLYFDEGGHSFTGTFDGNGTVVMTAPLTAASSDERFGVTWEGTFVLNWSLAGPTDVGAYGLAKSTVEIAKPTGAGFYFAAGGAAPTILPTLKLSATVTQEDGWDNQVTVISALTGSGDLVVNGASGSNSNPIPFTISKIEGYSGTLGGRRGEYTIGNIVFDGTPSASDCLVKASLEKDPVLTGAKVNGNDATLIYNGTATPSGIYLVVWPTEAAWNGGVAPSQAMQDAYTEWAAIPGNEAGAQHAAEAFLMGVNVGEYEAPVAEITFEDGVPKISSDDLANVKGVVYVLYGDSPTTIATPRALVFEDGKAVLPSDAASARFYKLCVGFTAPPEP